MYRKPPIQRLSVHYHSFIVQMQVTEHKFRMFKGNLPVKRFTLWPPSADICVSLSITI